MTNGPSADTLFLNDLLKNGGLILLEPRTYFISGDLTLAVDGTTLIGSGGTVILKTGQCQILVTANHCRIEGVKIDGNDQIGAGVSVTGSFNSILRCWSENNANPGGHGFVFNGGFLLPGVDLTSHCTFNEIRSCVAIGNEAVGIAQYHHWDGRVIDNVCLDNNLEGITVDVFSLRNLIMGNSLHNNCINGGVGAIGMDFADLNRVANNFIEQTRRVPGITFENEIGQSNFNIVSHNIIVNPSHGINLRADEDGPPRGAQDQSLQPKPRTSNNNLVTDNIIRGAIFDDNNGVLEDSRCVGNDIRGNKLTS